MNTQYKRIAAALVVIAGAGVAVWFTTADREKTAGPWSTTAEGFLAVATPCCYEASLWDSLDTVSADGQRARPASVAEAAQWLDEWPYRSREDRAEDYDAKLAVGVQSSEIRCRGPQPGGEIPRYEGDAQALEAIKGRRGCEVKKWKVWSEDTAKERPNERHSVWVDDDGHFHGRVDYWQP